MSEQEFVQAPQPRLKYPNSFLFGASVGVAVQAACRQFLMEPLSARPLSYVRFAVTGGVAMFYWDYWRRTAMEHIFEREDKNRYYQTMQAINFNMRVGDEDEVTNLTEYLAGATTRP